MLKFIYLDLMQRLYDYSVLILICIYLFVRQLFNNSISFSVIVSYDPALYYQNYSDIINIETRSINGDST